MPESLHLAAPHPCGFRLPSHRDRQAGPEQARTVLRRVGRPARSQLRRRLLQARQHPALCERQAVSRRPAADPAGGSDRDRNRDRLPAQEDPVGLPRRPDYLVTLDSTSQEERHDRARNPARRRAHGRQAHQPLDRRTPRRRRIRAQRPRLQPGDRATERGGRFRDGRRGRQGRPGGEGGVRVVATGFAREARRALLRDP